MRTLFLALLLTGCMAAEAPPATDTASKTAQPALTTYLGNEGLMVTDGMAKILFDPLYPNGFGIYQMVPDDMRTALMAGEAPFADVDAIFVSHMHPDHFDVAAIITYLERHTDTMLFAPAQAVEWMQEETEPDSEIFARVMAVPLNYGDAPLTYTARGLQIDVVRIPHSGWPDRAEVSNLVFRVTLPGGETVMHMGDADINDAHYAKHSDHWPGTRTDTAYPPYWFQVTDAGQDLIANRLNTDQAVGVHVPIIVPDPLPGSGEPFFHTPGETRPVSAAAAD